MVMIICFYDKFYRSSCLSCLLQMLSHYNFIATGIIEYQLLCKTIIALRQTKKRVMKIHRHNREAWSISPIGYADRKCALK